MHQALKSAALIFGVALVFCLAVPELRDLALLGLLIPAVFKVVNDQLEAPLVQLRATHAEATRVAASVERLLGR